MQGSFNQQSVQASDLVVLKTLHKKLEDLGVARDTGHGWQPEVKTSRCAAQELPPHSALFFLEVYQKSVEVLKDVSSFEKVNQNDM